MMKEMLRGPESVPGQPTDAPPGSARKVRVLMERAARREALFHPGDNQVRLLPAPGELRPAEEASELFDVEMAG